MNDIAFQQFPLHGGINRFCFFECCIYNPVCHSRSGNIRTDVFERLFLPVKRNGIDVFFINNVREKLCGTKTVRDQRGGHIRLFEPAFLHVLIFSISAFVCSAFGAFKHLGIMFSNKKFCRDIYKFVSYEFLSDCRHFTTANVAASVLNIMNNFLGRKISDDFLTAALFLSFMLRNRNQFLFVFFGFRFVKHTFKRHLMRIFKNNFRLLGFRAVHSFFQTSNLLTEVFKLRFQF